MAGHRQRAAPRVSRAGLRQLSAVKVHPSLNSLLRRDPAFFVPRSRKCGTSGQACLGRLESVWSALMALEQNHPMLPARQPAPSVLQAPTVQTRQGVFSALPVGIVNLEGRHRAISVCRVSSRIRKRVQGQPDATPAPLELSTATATRRLCAQTASRQTLSKSAWHACCARPGNCPLTVSPTARRAPVPRSRRVACPATTVHFQGLSIITGHRARTLEMPSCKTSRWWRMHWKLRKPTAQS